MWIDVVCGLLSLVEFRDSVTEHKNSLLLCVSVAIPRRLGTNPQVLSAYVASVFVFTNSKVPGFDGSLRSPARDDGLAAISD